jgi:hypothetical protein
LRNKAGRETADKQENLNLEDKQMADRTIPDQLAADHAAKKKTINLSLDGWAVAIALLLAALVRLGVLKHVAW